MPTQPFWPAPRLLALCRTLCWLIPAQRPLIQGLMLTQTQAIEFNGRSCARGRTSSCTGSRTHVSRRAPPPRAGMSSGPAMQINHAFTRRRGLRSLCALSLLTHPPVLLACPLLHACNVPILLPVVASWLISGCASGNWLSGHAARQVAAPGRVLDPGPSVAAVIPTSKPAEAHHY
jgi:hypothetical protein